MTKQVLSILMISSLALFSCKGNKSKALIKTWRAVAVDNPSMDSSLKQAQEFIDTLGKTTDAATNLATYGTTNIDSLKKISQVQLDSVKLMQKEQLKLTVFTFRKDSVAVLSFGMSMDSMRWHMDTDSSIILSNMGGIGTLEQIKMGIVTLSDAELKLKFVENGSSSVVTFHPEAK